MTYAKDRVCWDADSHLMEDADFLEKHVDAKYKEALRISGGQGGGESFAKGFGEMLASVRKRIADPEQTAALEENVIGAKAKGWFAHGAVDGAERRRTLDLLGFKGQLVFSTFAGGFLANRDHDVVYAGVRAHSRAMADFCGDDDRLLAVGMIPLVDPKRACEELEAAVELGCKAIHVPSDAPGGNQRGFSPSHVDVDPFWARLEEMDVPLMLHIGGGKLLPKAYHDTGRPRPTDWLGGGENLRGKDFHAVHHSPENFLATMILDGVFEEHPKLRCGVIEQGASWVPGMMRNLDYAARSFSRTEPILKSLSLKPSEYIGRQVRFTPFPFEDLGWLIEQCGEDLFLFSSDYPHPEGGRDPIAKFEDSMDAAGIGAVARDKFYEGNFVGLMKV